MGMVAYLGADHHMFNKTDTATFFLSVFLSFFPPLFFFFYSAFFFVHTANYKISAERFETVEF